MNTITSSINSKPQREMSSSDDSERAYLTDENNSIMSDQSEDITGQSCMVFDYDENSIDPDDSMQADSPDTSVLMRLDSLLREKINLEVEDFQTNLHQILNSQINLIQNLMKLTRKSNCIYKDNSQDIIFDAYKFTVEQTTDTEKCNNQCSDEKDKLLIDLFASATIISKTLRRPEFKTN